MGSIPSAPVMLALKYFVLVDDCCYNIIVAVIACAPLAIIQK
jgi:hypothetical protein